MSMNIYAVTNADGQAYNSWDVNKKLEDLGIPDDVIEKGEAEIEQYAFDNNIDLNSLQVEVKKTEPKKLDGADKNTKQDFKTKLEALGIPADVVEQGKDAVKAYAAKNNIKLPEPPNKGAAVNISA